MSDCDFLIFHGVYVSVGSNVADGLSRVEKAMQWMRSRYDVEGESTVYITESATGGPAMYHNAVVKLNTCCDFEELNRELKDYEALNGRVRDHRYKEVAIDLDIVIFDTEIVRQWDYAQYFFAKGFRQLELE